MSAVMYDSLMDHALSAFGHDQVQYFSPPAPVQELPVYCLDAGSVAVPPGADYPLHVERHPDGHRHVAHRGRRLQEFQLVLIAQGRGIFQSEGRDTQAITAGTVLVLFPDWWHRYIPDPLTGWHEFWVGFSGSAVSALIATVRIPAGPVVIPPGPHQREILQLYERILRNAIRPGVIDHIEMAALAQQLVTVVARVHGTGGDPGGYDDRFERVRDAMIRAVRGSVDIPALESLSGCSRATLQRLFRDRTGLSPYRYFLTIKIDAASWVLANTERSIKEVAREYGFSDQYHFSRVFREIRGVSPGAWRTRCMSRLGPDVKGGR